MAPSVSQPNLPTPLLVSEKRKDQAKAELRGVRKADINVLYAQLGECLAELMCGERLTLKEFAALLKKDERQLQRQMEGKERPQLEAVFAIERFRAPLVIALAKWASGVEVVTEIRVRRSA